MLLDWLLDICWKFCSTWLAFDSSTVMDVIFHLPATPDGWRDLCLAGGPGLALAGLASLNSSNLVLLCVETSFREFTFLREVCLSSSASLSICPCLTLSSSSTHSCEGFCDEQLRSWSEGAGTLLTLISSDVGDISNIWYFLGGFTGAW